MCFQFVVVDLTRGYLTLPANLRLFSVHRSGLTGSGDLVLDWSKAGLSQQLCSRRSISFCLVQEWNTSPWRNIPILQRIRRPGRLLLLRLRGFPLGGSLWVFMMYRLFNWNKSDPLEPFKENKNNIRRNSQIVFGNQGSWVWPWLIMFCMYQRRHRQNPLWLTLLLYYPD